MQKWGIDFWEAYSPVVNWMSIQVLLSLAQIHDLQSCSINFVLAFPQAKQESNVYMEIPAGFDLTEFNQKAYVLKLNNNLYELCDAGLNWFKHLSTALKKRGFKSSEIDPCVFYSQDSIILVYVNDCIIFAKDQSTIKRVAN